MSAINAQFQLDRPKVQRVYVTARDPDTGDSKSTTLYNISPEKFIESVRGAAGESAGPDDADSDRDGKGERTA